MNEASRSCARCMHSEEEHLQGFGCNNGNEYVCGCPNFLVLATDTDSARWKAVTAAALPPPLVTRNSGDAPAVATTPRDRSKRPTLTDYYLESAVRLSERSTCRRLAVGCIITDPDGVHVYANGYNGNARGLVNDCDSDTPGACGCLHAEENATLKVSVPHYVEKFVYCTNQPCKMCAKRLIQIGGVVKVIYLQPYRLKEGLDVLRQARIDTQMHLISGWTRGENDIALPPGIQR